MIISDFPWAVIAWAGGVAAGIGVLVFRFNQHMRHYREDVRRNCAHHGILFKKLDIPYDEVLEAERGANAGPKRL